MGAQELNKIRDFISGGGGGEGEVKGKERQGR